MKTLFKISGFLLLGLLMSNCAQKTTAPVVADPMPSKEMTPTVGVNDFRKNAPKAGAAPVINIGNSETFVLDNGLQVIVVENHKIPSVSFQITLKNEQVNEYDKVGYVSMAGDLMGRGTATKSKSEVDEAVDFIGASLNTFGSGMYASSLTKHSSVLLDIVTDILYNPAMSEQELDKIKKQTISNLESNKTDPDAMSQNMRAVAIYGADHPYGEIQKIENVENITVEDCKDYVEKFFAPNNAYLVVVGDITPAEAKKTVTKYFGKWEKKKVPVVKNKPVVAPTKTNVLFANKDGAVQSVVNISYPIDLKPGSEDAIKARLMNTILGGGSSSRVNLNIREDKGYTYGAQTSLRRDRLVGNFNAFASVRNTVTDSSIVEFLAEMNRIVNEPVDEKELQMTKNYLTGTFSLALESPRQVANFALNTIRYNLPKDYYQTYLKKLNATTSADIQEMARKYIRPEAALICVVGSKDEVAKSLLPFDDDGEITYYDAYGTVMKYDAVALPADLTPARIIADYLDALGGSAKLKGVKTLRMKMNADLMGQTADIESYQMGGDKFAMAFGMGGMIMQQQVFDGTKVKMSGQGQNQIITEGPMFDEIKSGAKIVAQRDYLTDGTELSVKGIEDVDGVKAYKLSIKSSEGKMSTEFYAVESGLMIRSIRSPQEGQTITTDFLDYKEVSGILFPHVTKVAGLMPMTLEMKVVEIEINGSVPAGTFTIE
jgi:zinc protease